MITPVVVRISGSGSETTPRSARTVLTMPVSRRITCQANVRTSVLDQNGNSTAIKSSPAKSCRPSDTPALSSSVALRIAPNMIDAPKKTTSVQSTVSRSTGRHHTHG